MGFGLWALGFGLLGGTRGLTLRSYNAEAIRGDENVSHGSHPAIGLDSRSSMTVRWPAQVWSAWLPAAILFFLAAFPLQESLTRFPRGLLADDAYFYVKTAWNLGVHGTSTFDGIHSTDGYHLAWQAILAAVSFIARHVSENPAVHLGAMLWLYLMMCWSIGLLFGRSRVDVLLLFSMGLIFKTMMETTLLSLVLLLLCANVYLVPHEPGSASRAPDWSGRAWLLLIPLIRVDATLIGAVMALSRVFQATPSDQNSQPGSKMKSVAVDLAWLAVGVGLQFALRRWFLGEWTSVSMDIKSSPGSMAQRIQNNLIGLYGSNLISTAIFLFLLALATWAAMRRGVSERTRDLVALSAPALFVLMHLAGNNQIAYWYFLPAAYVHVWYFLRFGPPATSRAGWPGRAAIAMLPLLVVAKWAVDSRIRGPQIEWSRHFVEELKRVVPEDEPVFQIDASGWVGWFSGRHVVNGDGLVNDHAYARRLREQRLGGYLHEEGIRYIVHNLYPRDNILINIAGLTVPMESVDVVIPPPPNYPEGTAFGLYRLK